MRTAVVFDCESSKLFERGKKRSACKTEEEERREEISRMECTVSCALVIPAAVVDAIASAPTLVNQLLECDVGRITCWRDRASFTSNGVPVPPFEPLLAAFDEAAVIVGYNQLSFDMPLLRKYYGKDMQRYMSHILTLDKCVIRSTLQRLSC